jgi:hypothetical protein
VGVKQPGREADHSSPSSTEVKECVNIYLHSPIRLHGVVLSLKHRDNFTFVFIALAAQRCRSLLVTCLQCSAVSIGKELVFQLMVTL